MGDEEEKNRRVVVESLGWLTESSILPKKHRAIKGVGASSILELKAQLYKSQEEAKISKQSSVAASSDINYHRAKKKITPSDPFFIKNSGVEARAQKDKLELKAIKDGSASYVALEKKAELYDKLLRGSYLMRKTRRSIVLIFFARAMSKRIHSNHRAMILLFQLLLKMKMVTMVMLLSSSIQNLLSLEEQLVL